MAIKGLTDRSLSFPEIGQIRKGAKKTSEDRPGQDLTYFRVEFDEKETAAAETFLARYGAQPTEINVILPFNEIDRMWDAWLEAYTAGRMVARSDGEKFTYLVDTKTGAILVKGGIDVKTGQPRPYIEGQPVGTWRNQKKNRDEPILCKPTGRLKVVVPELGRAAYLTVMTTSVHDIANLSAQLQAFQQVNGGRIAGIPLVLRRRPKKISTPNQDGTRARRVKWMLSIEADPDWVKRMLTEVKRLALPGNGLALLPDGNHGEPEEEVTREAFEDHEDQEFEDGEFSEAQEPDFDPAEVAYLDSCDTLSASGKRFGDLKDSDLQYCIDNPARFTAAQVTAARNILDWRKAHAA